MTGDGGTGPRSIACAQFELDELRMMSMHSRANDSSIGDDRRSVRRVQFSDAAAVDGKQTRKSHTVHQKKLNSWTERRSRKLLPWRDNATFDDWKSGHYTIRSFDPSVWARNDVMPAAVLCSGIGGVEKGIKMFNRNQRSADGKWIIPAVAIDVDATTCETHRLNHPDVPIVNYNCVEWRATQRVIEKYIPKQYWKKMWIHTSNSCKESSPTNFGKRNIVSGQTQTLWFIRMMQRMNPGVWTLENVPVLYKYFAGKFPTVKVHRLNEHCDLPQNRTRMIISNRVLSMPKYQGAQRSLRDALGDDLGLEPGQRYFQGNGWARKKSVDYPSYGITSGSHRAGSETVGEMTGKHMLTSEHRATLQGWRGAKFATSANETTRRDLIAQVVPPPFAEALAAEVSRVLSTSSASTRVDTQPSVELNLCRIEQLKEQDIDALVRDVAQMKETKSVDRGIHGHWSYLGESFGWVRKDLITPATLNHLLRAPWNVIREPPETDMAFVNWHRDNMLRAMMERAEREEQICMNDNDKAERKEQKPIDRLYRNVHPNPDVMARWNSNASLQKSDPNNYGPYLDEGEAYFTPRNDENVSKACEQMGLTKMKEEWKSEYDYYRALIYEHWVLFDGRNRAVKGVLIDVDVSGLTPIQRHPYRWSPAKIEGAKPLIDEFLRDGLIKRAVSEWSFPASVVPKPNGTGLRLVVDIRELNEQTPQDRYESPNCDLCLEWMMQRPFRTVFDLRWGFHQLELSNATKQVFTFTSPLGCYSYNRLLMGYINSTSIFQRVVNYTLGDSLWRNAVMMVDDGAIGSKELMKHREDNREVWTKLAQRHHTVKPSKMSILPREVKYLGHVITENGIRASDDHVKAIKEMPAPHDADGMVDETGVRSFVGMVKYLRRYIPRCGHLCTPLNGLLSKDSSGKWEAEHQAAFDELKTAVVNSTGSWNLDHSKPVYICTDGSKVGVGGYIYQKVNGEERIVSYYSRSTTKDEKKWDTRHLEVLAIIVTLEHFNHYIDGLDLTLQTDHKNLKWLMDMKDPGGRLGRWVLRLQRHRFKVEYRPGKHNEVADALSRLPLPADNPVDGLTHFHHPETEEEDLLMIQLTEFTEGSAHFEVHFSSWDDDREHEPIVDDDLRVFEHKVLAAEEMRALAVPDTLKHTVISLDDIRVAQASDPECIGVRLRLANGDKRVCKQFESHDDVLYKVWHAGEGDGDGWHQDTMRPALPKKLRPVVMHNAHGTIYGGHVNSTGMYKQIASEYFWPAMERDIQEYVSTCEHCQLAKGTKPHRHGLMLGHKWTEPGTHLTMDLVGPIGTDISGGTSKNQILVVLDPTTHFPYFIPISGKTMEEVAMAFADRVLLEHGTVDTILTDNGSEFKNKTMKSLMALLKTEHQFAPAYHPRGNQTERINRWLGETLRAVLANPLLSKAEWPLIVKYLEFAYRRLPIPGTNITPFEAARGRLPKIPASLQLASESASAYKSLDDTTQEVVRNMTIANKLVRDAVEKVRQSRRDEWNASHVRVDFEPGELVRFWNRVPSRKGEEPSKLKLRNAVYEVVDMHGTMVNLKDVDGGGSRTAHVTQLARFRRSTVPAPEETPTADRAYSDKVWGRLTPGTMVLFHIKGEDPAALRVAEVLEVDKDTKSMTIWYYIHGGAGAKKFDPEKRLVERSLVPEWYDDRNNVHIKPKNTQKLFKRDYDWTASKITLIAGGFTLQRDKVPKPVLRMADAWLKSVSRSDNRALSALNDVDDEDAVSTIGLLRERLVYDGRAQGDDLDDEAAQVYEYFRAPMGLPISPLDHLNKLNRMEIRDRSAWWKVGSAIRSMERAIPWAAMAVVVTDVLSITTSGVSTL